MCMYYFNNNNKNVVIKHKERDHPWQQVEASTRETGEEAALTKAVEAEINFLIFPLRGRQ